MANRWAIIPVKQLTWGKSRLAEVLSCAERVTLIKKMLHRTIKVTQEAKGIDQVVLISKDNSILDIGRHLHTKTLLETGVTGLNNALQQATQYAIDNGADGLVILPSDLPCLSVFDLEYLITWAGQPPEMIIVPDRHGEGTNLLVLSPPGIISYQFGQHSFKLHIEQAAKRKFSLKIINNHSISLDLDLPEDLQVINWVATQSKDPYCFIRFNGAGYDLRVSSTK